MDTIKYPNKKLLNPLPESTNAQDWEGLNGTKAPYIEPALDETGFPDDSTTGDADVGF